MPVGSCPLVIPGGFPDIPQDYYKKFKHTFTVDDVKRYVVTQIRIYHPEVVITQDVNGEYGHWQHKVLSEGVQQAVVLAADPSYQPKGYPKYDAWQVKKLYVHLYEKNKLTLDVNTPIAELDGKTAFDAAKEAYQCHATQTKNNNHEVSTTQYSIAEFGLAYTAVGEDTSGMNDMFEHIDPYTLSVTPSPEPTEEPTPEPTPAPTDTPEPTEQPTEIPTPAPTDTPQPTEIPATAEPAATPEPETPKEESDTWILYAGGGLLLLLIVLLVVLLIVRKRR